MPAPTPSPNPAQPRSQPGTRAGGSAASAQTAATPSTTVDITESGGTAAPVTQTPASTVKKRVSVEDLIKPGVRDGKKAVVCAVPGCSGKWSASAGSQKTRYLEHYAAKHKEIEVYDPKAPTGTQPSIVDFVRTDREGTLTSFCDMMATLGMPFNHLSNPLFRMFMTRGHGFNEGEVPHRKGCGKLLDDHKKKQIALVAQHFPSPTICIDIGTVFRRYLLFTIVQSGNVLIVRAVDQMDMPDQRMTLVSVKDAVQQVIESLRELGITPVAVVADNASNVQGIAGRQTQAADDQDEEDGEAESDDNEEIEEEEEEEVEEMDEVEEVDRISHDGVEIPAEDPTVTPNELREIKHMAKQLADSSMLFVMRCAAHGLQLIVQDLKPEWDESLRTAMAHRAALVKQKVKLPKYMEPKWNSGFHLIHAVSKISHYRDGPHPLPERDYKALLRSVQMLAPLNGATNFIQRDNATVFDTLAMLTSLYVEFTGPEHPNNEAERSEKQLKDKCRTALDRRLFKFITVPQLVVLYFMPFFDLTEVDQVIASMVRDALIKINPLCEPEYTGPWTMRPMPAVMEVTEVSYDVFEAFVTRELPLEMRKTVLQIAQASATEASVERAFSEMKRVVPPIRNRLGAENVEATLVVSSAARLKAKLALEQAQRDESKRQPRPENEVPLNLRIARRRNQHEFNGWAKSISKAFAQQVFDHYQELRRYDPTLKEPIANRLRNRSLSVICAVPGCKEGNLNDHTATKAYFTCLGHGTPAKCRANKVANAKCARGNPAAYLSVNGLESIPGLWRCADCERAATGTAK